MWVYEMNDQTEQVRGDMRVEYAVAQLLAILARPLRFKNNAALLGDHSADRLSVITATARRITCGDAPPPLSSHRVFALDIDALVRKAADSGVISRRLNDLFETLGKPLERNILFVDNLHYLVGADMRRYPLDAAPLLKSALGHHKFQVMGALTLREYHIYIECDAALQRRFQHVFMDASAPGSPSSDGRGGRG